MFKEFTFILVRGTELRPWIDILAALRIEVFREFPYLYDGDLSYERDYLETYLRSPRSLVIFANCTDGRTVGATTCVPMKDEADGFRTPFEQLGISIESLLYLGESIVLPEFRGRGLGREFFARREAYARLLGFFKTTFCAVDRPANHLLRPKLYRSLDSFWHNQGYQKHPELKAEFSWREIGEIHESRKTLTFWTKSIPV